MIKVIKLDIKKIMESLGHVKLKVGKWYTASQPHVAYKHEKRYSLGSSQYEPEEKTKNKKAKKPIKVSKAFKI